jgi:hypothetical protein
MAQNDKNLHHKAAAAIIQILEKAGKGSSHAEVQALLIQIAAIQPNSLRAIKAWALNPTSW